MSRDSVKKNFLEYLRMTYGAESSQVSSALPPLRPAFNFPAFQKKDEGLNALAGMPQPGMGMGGGMQPQMGMGAPQMPQGGMQRRPDAGVQSAQRALLGGGGY